MRFDLAVVAKDRLMRKVLTLGAVVLLLGGGMFFSARKESLKVGDRAPDFALTDQNGASVKLGDFLGKKNVVLAFYIKAFTPG